MRFMHALLKLYEFWISSLTIPRWNPTTPKPVHQRNPRPHPELHRCSGILQHPVFHVIIVPRRPAASLVDCTSQHLRRDIYIWTAFNEKISWSKLSIIRKWIHEMRVKDRESKAVPSTKTRPRRSIPFHLESYLSRNEVPFAYFQIILSKRAINIAIILLNSR